MTLDASGAQPVKVKETTVWFFHTFFKILAADFFPLFLVAWLQKTQAEIDEERALQRQLEAVAWTDKELRKLIAQIKELGTCENGQCTVAYGHLFVKTGNIFEALSGTLLTAKKQGVVTYEGQLLLQGAHDRVVVTLLKEEIADSTLETYMRKRPSGQAAAAAASAASHKGSAFGAESMKNAMLPCYICSKTVYPMEVKRDRGEKIK
jgi:hypothetical protein